MRIADYRLTREIRDELTDLYYEKGYANTITYLANQYADDQITVLEFGLFCAHIEGMFDHDLREFHNMTLALEDELKEMEGL